MHTDMIAPEVVMVTSHGKQVLPVQRGERLIDVLARHGVPWSALSIYVVPAAGGSPRITPCLDQVLHEYREASQILLYFNRNVNPFKFSVSDFTVVEGEGGEATEYIYQDLQSDADEAKTYLKKLSPDECRSIIAARVREMITEAIPESEANIVVGVSGGGDSNAMLHGLTQLDLPGITITPVILMGIPDWDNGVPRAKELCEKYDLPLTVITEPEVRSLLGMDDDGVPLIERFERTFRGDDFEFMGTLLIRLALSRKAKELGTPYIATGLNLEDVLCEALYRTSAGMQVAGLPSRAIGDTTLLFPLWLCPKRIIDGCFPKYSLDNYDARYPCFSLGRNLYYSMVYTLQSSFPGMCERLAQGFAEMSREDRVTYTFNEQLGFHTERGVPLPLVMAFKKMLGGATVPQ